MKVGITHLLQVPVYLKLTVNKKKKTKRTTRDSRKSCNKGWKTKATFILKKIYFR
jgi:hypothetical protein